MYVLQELQDIVGRVAGKDAEDELMMVRKEIVDFHGEMVLLENYSALNYTGMCLIIILIISMLTIWQYDLCLLPHSRYSSPVLRNFKIKSI